jgi:PepSY-associated TM region
MNITRTHRWHRRVGLCVAVVIVVLAATGIVLTYSDALRLDKRFISAASVLDWYAVRPAAPPTRTYSVGSHWISQQGSRLYFDAVAFPTAITTLHGADIAGDTIIAAVDQELWLLTPEGELIERMGGADGIPPAIEAIGLTKDGKPTLLADQKALAIDLDSGAVVATDGEITWATPATPPPALAQTLNALYRGRELTLERVILDLHTGRIFGTVGVTVVNLSALAMIFLAGSGAVTWWRRWQRMHRRHH